MALNKRDPIDEKLKAARAAAASTTPVRAVPTEPEERPASPGEGYVPPAYIPPERIDTEQLNVRIDRRLVDAAKAKHRTTGESMKGIVTRALTALLESEGDL